MVQENRKGPRISTNIVTEISIDGEFPKSCGYIKNLGKEGMGLISLDTFDPEQKISPSFNLNVLPGKISPHASLVHSQKLECNLYFHGFKFDSLSEKEEQAITRFLEGNNILSSAV